MTRARKLTATGYEAFDRFGDNRPGMGIALRASTSTTDADPGEGFFKWNNATQGEATYLYVSTTAADGSDISTALAGMVDGQRFQITQADDTGRWQSFRLTGAPVSATGYYKLPVARVAQSAGVVSGYTEIITGGSRPGGARAGGALVVFDITSGGGAGGESPVLSVNAQTGVVALDAADVGADATGTAAAAIAAHEAAADPHPQYLTEAEANNLYQAINSASGNVLVTGGGVAWISGLIFRVSAASYLIQGTAHTSTETEVTLSAADPSDPRIDVIAVNASGNVVVIEGTPAASPSKPDVDPQTELELTFVYIDAAATEPTDVVLSDVYHENTEWTTSRSGTTFTLASTNNPRAGTVCVEGSAVTTGNYVQFQAPSPLDPASRDRLVFYIRSKAAWPSTRSLVLTLRSSGAQRGQAVTFQNGSFGFDSTVTGAYQQIVVPMSLFGANGLSVNQLRIACAGSGSTIGLYLDDITLQGGVYETVGGTSWGSITGTLSSQSDLQAALDAKLDDSQASAFGLTLLDDANAAAGRATLAAAAQSQTGEHWSGLITSPSDKDYTLVLKAPHAGTITETTTKSASGTCTATFKIGSTALGGTANSVSSTEESQAHASANAFAAGDDIVLTVSSNSSCADLAFTIKYTRTLA